MICKHNCPKKTKKNHTRYEDKYSGYYLVRNVTFAVNKYVSLHFTCSSKHLL